MIGFLVLVYLIIFCCWFWIFVLQKNWNLFSVNVAMAATGIYQLTRKIKWDQTLFLILRLYFIEKITLTYIGSNKICFLMKTSEAYESIWQKKLKVWQKKIKKSIWKFLFAFGVYKYRVNKGILLKTKYMQTNDGH